MAKMSNISILNPIVKSHIRKKEEEIGRKLNRQERHEFIKDDKKKIKRSMLKTTFIVALASVGITFGAKALLPEGNNNGKNIVSEDFNTVKNNDNKNHKTIKDTLKVTEVPTVSQKPSKTIAIEDLLKDNNIDIDKDNIGIIKSKPQFITIDRKGNYVYDYKEKTDAKDYITDNLDIDEMFSIVDNSNSTIITSLGKIKDKYVNIDSKQVKVADKEFVKGKNSIDLTVNNDESKKSQEELEVVYNSLNYKFEKIIQQQEENER